MGVKGLNQLGKLEKFPLGIGRVGVILQTAFLIMNFTNQPLATIFHMKIVLNRFFSKIFSTLFCTNRNWQLATVGHEIDTR